MLIKLKKKSWFLNTNKLWRDAHNYHVWHQWRLEAGLFVPHLYSDMTPESLSWWDDLGFIYAKRRVLVNWQHPRMVYMNQLEDKLYTLCAPLSPYAATETPKRGLYNRFARKSTPLSRYGKKKYRKLGQSRKKCIGRITFIGDEEQTYYRKRNAILAELSSVDHGYAISPAIYSEWSSRYQRIDIIAPLDIRCKKELAILHDIALDYLKGNTQILSEMPVYTFKDWSTDGSNSSIGIPLSHGVNV